MWQRFTERARRAILIAQEEAGLLQSKEVTTSHLLLALLTETDSPAGQFLQATGLSADGVRQVLADQSSAIAVPVGSQLSVEMKNLLGDAAQVARELQHHDIDSHHLLLALLSSPKSDAAKILQPPKPSLKELPAGLLARLSSPKSDAAKILPPPKPSLKELHAGLLAQLKEYPPSAPPDADLPPAPSGRSLFQRFTERSRRVILLAQEEAHRMESGYVGAEHLFLGLVCENEGSAAQMLIRMGIERETVRNAIEALEGYRKKIGGEFALTPQAKRVLELSAHEANELRHNPIGTEHLLLALLHPECGLAPLLKKLDLSTGEIRRQIVEYLG